ncbi:MAG: HDIG domain-containing metalloprotein [Acetanaerobacterium sp.]
MTPDKALFLDLERHLMNDEHPAQYLAILSEKPEFRAYPFSMLYSLVETMQSPQHHPEGSVWNHTMLVVDEAAKAKGKSSDARAFLWAALLHDAGKFPVTSVHKGRITAYDHDRAGAALAREFLSCFTDDERLIGAVYYLVRYHMQILYVVNNLPFADIKGMKEHTDIHEIALLGLCDRLGRTGSDRQKEERNIRIFLDRCE